MNDLDLPLSMGGVPFNYRRSGFIGNPELETCINPRNSLRNKLTQLCLGTFLMLNCKLQDFQNPQEEEVWAEYFQEPQPSGVTLCFQIQIQYLSLSWTNSIQDAVNLIPFLWFLKDGSSGFFLGLCWYFPCLDGQECLITAPHMASITTMGKRMSSLPLDSDKGMSSLSLDGFL